MICYMLLFFVIQTTRCVLVTPLRFFHLCSPGHLPLALPDPAGWHPLLHLQCPHALPPEVLPRGPQLAVALATQAPPLG